MFRSLSRLNQSRLTGEEWIILPADGIHVIRPSWGKPVDNKLGSGRSSTICSGSDTTSPLTTSDPLCHSSHLFLFNGCELVRSYSDRLKMLQTKSPQIQLVQKKKKKKRNLFTMIIINKLNAKSQKDSMIMAFQIKSIGAGDTVFTLNWINHKIPSVTNPYLVILFYVILFYGISVLVSLR